MRNKIYISNKKVFEKDETFCFIDIGIYFSMIYLKNPVEFETEAKFDSFYYFKQLLENEINESKTRIYFYNIGFFLEKTFSLDVAKFLLDYAKNYQVVIVKDEFMIVEGNSIHWKTNEYNSKIEFGENVLEFLD